MNRFNTHLIALVLGVSLLAAPALADTFGTGANSFAIDFVTIDDPGNPPDMMGGIPIHAGSVPYEYRIGKYEISEQMVDKANALGGLGITKDTRGPDKPATSVSWYEAAKFVNWLNTSTGNHPAYKFDSNGNFELWQPSDPGYMPGILFRNSLAKYFLPSVDEWYKAAYYDPSAGVYYRYPTGSNDEPTFVPSGTAPGTAVYFFQSGPADIMQAGGLSPYGTMGQGGNAAEWNETSFSRFPNSPDVSGRVFRGGDWDQVAAEMSRGGGNAFLPDIERANIGFRVAGIVPEPGTCALLSVGFLALFGLRRFSSIERRHCHAQHNRWLEHIPGEIGIAAEEAFAAQPCQSSWTPASHSSQWKIAGFSRPLL